MVKSPNGLLNESFDKISQSRTLRQNEVLFGLILFAQATIFIIFLGFIPIVDKTLMVKYQFCLVGCLTEPKNWLLNLLLILLNILVKVPMYLTAYEGNFREVASTLITHISKTTCSILVVCILSCRQRTWLSNDGLFKKRYTTGEECWPSMSKLKNCTFSNFVNKHFLYHL